MRSRFVVGFLALTAVVALAAPVLTSTGVAAAKSAMSSGERSAKQKKCMSQWNGPMTHSTMGARKAFMQKCMKGG